MVAFAMPHKPALVLFQVVSHLPFIVGHLTKARIWNQSSLFGRNVHLDLRQIRSRIVQLEEFRDHSKHFLTQGLES